MLLSRNGTREAERGRDGSAFYGQGVLSDLSLITKSMIDQQNGAEKHVQKSAISDTHVAVLSLSS